MNPNLKPFTSEYQPPGHKKSRKGIPNRATVYKHAIQGLLRLKAVKGIDDIKPLIDPLLKKVEGLHAQQLKKAEQRRIEAQERKAKRKRREFYRDVTDDQRREFSIAYDEAIAHWTRADELWDNDDSGEAVRYAGSNHVKVEAWMVADFKNRQSSKHQPYRLAHYLAAIRVGLPIHHNSRGKRAKELIGLQTLEGQRRRGDELRGIKRK